MLPAATCVPALLVSAWQVDCNLPPLLVVLCSSATFKQSEQQLRPETLVLLFGRKRGKNNLESI
jgi:hypothetical protein